MTRPPKERLSQNPRIIFMGTPDFAVPPLRALVEQGFDLVAVITQPDRPRGRGQRMLFSPVKQQAMEYGLEILQPQKVSSPELCEAVRRKSPDILVVVAFGQILSKTLLEIPKWGALNIHASLLPKYRGAAPIQWAIINDEEKTGLTAMRMETGLDSGPILLQKEIVIGSKDTTGTVHDRLSMMSGDFLVNTLDALMEGRLHEVLQDETRVSYAPKLDKEISLVTWEHSAQALSAFIRGFDPSPGAFTKIKQKQIKLFSPRVVSENRIKGVPGCVVGFSSSGLEVETGKGVLQIQELQAPGKKRLGVEDFLRGFPIATGTVLG